MVDATFEQEGNRGTLSLETHFNRQHEISCVKSSDEAFRVGGTAVSEVMQFEGLILESPINKSRVKFRAFKTPYLFFEDKGILSFEEWSDANRHCYIIEYYPLEMEGNKPEWLISKTPLKEAHNLFVNVDVLDGGGNIVKRYRVSTFTGEYILMENLNV